VRFAYAYSYFYGNSYRNRDIYTYAYGDIHAYRHVHTDGNGHSHVYSHGYRNFHADVYSHINSDPNLRVPAELQLHVDNGYLHPRHYRYH
jgi:hypothetical protein